MLLVIGVVALFFFLEYRRTHVTTDDAYVDGHIHIVASKVPGTVLALHVKDNQLVKKDDPILDIDPVDYRVALQEAQANLEMEKARLTEVQSRVETARKQLHEIRAALDSSRSALKAQEALTWKADEDLKRAEPLIKEQIVTQEYYDQRRTNLRRRHRPGEFGKRKCQRGWRDPSNRRKRSSVRRKPPWPLNRP